MKGIDHVRRDLTESTTIHEASRLGDAGIARIQPICNSEVPEESLRRRSTEPSSRMLLNIPIILSLLPRHPTSSVAFNLPFTLPLILEHKHYAPFIGRSMPRPPIITRRCDLTDHHSTFSHPRRERFIGRHVELQLPAVTDGRHSQPFLQAFSLSWPECPLPQTIF